MGNDWLVNIIAFVWVVLLGCMTLGVALFVWLYLQFRYEDRQRSKEEYQGLHRSLLKQLQQHKK